MNKSLLTKVFSVSADSLLVGFFILILASTFGFAVKLAPVSVANNQVLGASAATELNFYLNTTSTSQFKLHTVESEQLQIQVVQLPAGVSRLSLAQIANASEREQQFLVDLQLSAETRELLDFKLNFAGVSYELKSGESARFIATKGLNELTLEIVSDKQINFPVELVIKLEKI